MVFIHSMDLDEELQVQTYEEPDAYVVSTTDERSDITMPKVDSQSGWFEYEDRIDDWLGITTTTLDPDKHGPSLKNA